eukprot:TRINITY_DN2844_c0_g1_i1.p1 TRINITY_DN2844_c0_g1~~TRINITY_DN2844_c0_g1_i1.p1  ORF type:complete len:164 (-),score=24.14 TRINITY_DN2844_c0_g1_i1:101-592(-)
MEGGSVEWVEPNNGYTVTTDRSKINIDVLHAFLSQESYWSKDCTRESVEVAVANSLPFSLLSPSGEFVGFARVLSDEIAFAYLSDVYVDKAHRKKKLSEFIVGCVLKHEKVAKVRSVMLLTRSAHSLYTKFGFQSVDGRLMILSCNNPSHPAGHFDPSLVAFQ